MRKVSMVHDFLSIARANTDCPGRVSVWDEVRYLRVEVDVMNICRKPFDNVADPISSCIMMGEQCQPDIFFGA